MSGEIMKMKKLHWSVYLIYTLVLITVLLFVRFPSEKFLQYCEYRLKEMFPQTRWQLDDSSWAFPATVSFEVVNISDVSTGDEILQFNDVGLKVHPMSLGKTIEFSASLYEGEVEGDIEFSAGEKNYTLFECAFAGVDLSRMQYLSKRYERRLTGKLSGKAELSGNLFEKKVHRGSGKLKVSSGNVEIRHAILSLTELDFNELAFGFQVKDDIVEISDGMLASPLLQADFSGNISPITPSIEMADLAVSGKLVLQNSFFREKPKVLPVVKGLQKLYKSTALPFTLSGTLMVPMFDFKE